MRTPSWCDRVLWKSLPGLEDRLVAKQYKSADSITTSDHSPIVALFGLKPILPSTLATSLPAQRSRKAVFVLSDVNAVLSQEILPQLEFHADFLEREVAVKSWQMPKTNKPKWHDSELPQLDSITSNFSNLATTHLFVMRSIRTSA
jgi:hypothetical protein